MKKLMSRLFKTQMRKNGPEVRVARSVPAPAHRPEPGPPDAQGQALQSLMNIDAYRHQLAGSSPELHQALSAIEMNLAHQLGCEFNRRPQE